MSKNQTEAAAVYGNKDTNKIYKVKDAAELNCFIVRQAVIELRNGGMIEIPHTARIQTYTPANYKKLSEPMGEFPSFFSEAKMKIEILHDPTI